MFRLFVFAVLGIFVCLEVLASEPVRSLRIDLPNAPDNAIRTSWPGIGCWFWTDEEFQPDGYKRFVDLYSEHTGIELLTTSIRHPVEVTDPEVHDQIKRAALYAKSHGLGMVMDLDVRLAREAFWRKYPDDLQEIVRIRDVVLPGTGEATVSVESMDLSDHYTFRSANTYRTVSSRVVRVYAYRTGPEGIAPATVSDITDHCRIVNADVRDVTIAIPCDASTEGMTVSLVAAFTLLTPDVFSPRLPEFERDILKQYADVPLTGACKDEWGFPGRFEVRTDDLWYSDAMAAAYALLRPGHDLVRDMLLMARGEDGREGERIAAINHYMEMSWQRNRDIENLYCAAVKEVFGGEAMLATHPTWYPFPGKQEVFKNGLSWWACKRDLAQTDETTPYSARTALAKKWRSPIWYNMYYSGKREDYADELWRAALAGGRVNFHPVYPGELEHMTVSLLDGDLMRAEQRVRLLNYISSSPVDCPVAVVFGHAAAMNWAGPSLGDSGVGLCDALWRAGYYADLIPSSEIGEGALTVADDGRLQYGIQQYSAAVLYRPQFSRADVAALFSNVSGTACYRVGDWTMDFDGRAFDGAAHLPQGMMVMDADACVADIVTQLREQGKEPQTPSESRGQHGFSESAVPRRKGMSRLIDGTVIVASGESRVLGDPIHTTFAVNGHAVAADAEGIVAVRLDASGNVQALAVGGLKSIRTNDFAIRLEDRVDVALWRDNEGAWRGVLQGGGGDVPNALASITPHWQRVRAPVPYMP
ncbi:MAG: hypothetical protein AMXMBFR84_38980 [Candidatus Hydrogenedentota bacterium]